MIFISNTECPRSRDPFYIASYYIKWVPTSWTYSKSIWIYLLPMLHRLKPVLVLVVVDGAEPAGPVNVRYCAPVPVWQAEGTVLQFFGLALFILIRRFWQSWILVLFEYWSIVFFNFFFTEELKSGDLSSFKNTYFVGVSWNLLYLQEAVTL